MKKELDQQCQSINETNNISSPIVERSSLFLNSLPSFEHKLGQENSNSELCFVCCERRITKFSRVKCEKEKLIDRNKTNNNNNNKVVVVISLQSFLLLNSIISITIYITMIEGLGKGVKYSLFVANAIIFIGGVIVFSIGVWTLNDRSFMERLLGTNLYVASAAILIVTGSIVAIISFLGTFGAYKEVKCMLFTYFIILVILFIVMVTAGICGYVFRLEVDDRMQQEMHSTIKLYGNDTQVTQAWDAVQAHFECCGMTFRPARGYELWKKENIRFKSETGPTVPESCCRSKEDDPSRRACLGKLPRREDTYYEGCYERMKEFVKSHALLVGGMAIGVSCLIIFGMVLSCALYMMIK